MKKFLVVFVIVLLVFSVGCSSKKNSTSPSTPTSQVAVVAMVGTTMQIVAVVDKNGNPISNATVTINGNNVPAYSSVPGDYESTMTFSAGQAISLKVSSSGNQDATASGNIPASAGSTNVNISGAITGSYMTLSNP